ncbi:hypothetical protein J2S90_002550 [Arthrobacter bambusae]|uniref:Uncharacterized protein n=1 Tax=Arthrobacter bambusae TaxID=1338426 RepID=A0AAW8DJL4_9MICC|nr:hypothetical protein [Arthrobacter bambusae]MDQ0127339.1 hypothetical protein [Arthrobacter bambusae]MDQ0178681.1 hypothetical protein [Arthrobacter bambusae]
MFGSRHLDLGEHDSHSAADWWKYSQCPWLSREKFGQDAGIRDPNGIVAWHFQVTGIDVGPT